VKFTYAPAGQDPQVFEFDAATLDADEAEIIEEAGGTQWSTFVEWGEKLDRGGFRAWRVVLWLLLRKANPDLGFEEVKPRPSELLFDVPDQPTDLPESAEGKSESGEESTDSP
jgi:hypothetical protein